MVKRVERAIERERDTQKERKSEIECSWEGFPHSERQSGEKPTDRQRGRKSEKERARCTEVQGNVLEEADGT